MKRISPANSSVIVGYQLLKQEMELESDKEHFAKIDKIQRTRRVKGQGKDVHSHSSVSAVKDIDFHRISFPEFYKRLQIDEDVSKNGLTTADALQRNLEQGDNALTEKEKSPWYWDLFKEFTSFFALLLWAGSLLCFIAYGFDNSDPSNLYLGIVLSIVVTITSLVTFFQNTKSASIMEGFKNFIPPQSKAIRDGKLELIPAAKLVVGDLIEVRMGDRIPADIRIISSDEMKVDNSSLTGESDPLIRKVECTNPEQILETKNVAFFGTLCNYGKGRGIVFNIGDNTIIGQIANLADSAEEVDTPIKLELNRFIKIITILAVIIGLVFFISGFILGYTVVQNIVFAIGIIVANVPEGLYATITVTLSVAAKKLSKRKVLVKNLESVETLGSTSCICSDKTGTLTQNIMTVENLWINGRVLKGENLEKKGSNFKYEYDLKDDHFNQLRLCAVMNSTATFTNALPEKIVNKLEKLKQHKANYEEELLKEQQLWSKELQKTPFYKRQMVGDASEIALMKFFQPIEDIV